MTDDFFRARLEQMIDLKHPLAALANRLPWTQLEATLAPALAHKHRDGKLIEDSDLFGPTLAIAGAGVSAAGRPRLSIRLMASLLYLKHAFNLTLARMALTQNELRAVFDHCFRHPNLKLARDSAWEEMMNSPQSSDDLLAMGELVKREVTARKFEFFYKLRNKYSDNAEQGVSESELAASRPTLVPQALSISSARFLAFS